jgi:hypothetical protein
MGMCGMSANASVYDVALIKYINNQNHSAP